MEVLSLRSSHVGFDLMNAASHAYHSVRLSNRKTHIDDCVGQQYNMYSTPGEEAADPFVAINRWKLFYLRFLGKHCGRVEMEYSDTELIASRCTVPNGTPSNGTVKVGQLPTDGEMQKLLDIVVKEVKLQRGRAGKYTTRCMRRGGGIYASSNSAIAQHCYLYTKSFPVWNTLVMKFWGGWDKDEKIETLIKYVMESELQDQVDVSDMLNPANRRGYHGSGEK
jgi:hypothetical protein